jgi:hypothetical protein
MCTSRSLTTAFRLATYAAASAPSTSCAMRTTVPPTVCARHCFGGAAAAEGAAGSAAAKGTGGLETAGGMEIRDEARKRAKRTDLRPRSCRTDPPPPEPCAALAPTSPRPQKPWPQKLLPPPRWPPLAAYPESAETMS